MRFGGELSSLFASEWRADSAALASDGQYWTSVFGGARIVLSCIRCSPPLFCAFRLVLAAATGVLLFLELYRKPFGGYWMLSFDHWTLVLQTLYFVLAATLTFVATCAGSSITRSTPFVVRVTELAYGALLPAAGVNFLVALCAHWAHADDCVSRIALDASIFPRDDLIIASGVLLVALLDATFSRQPYYSSFHAIVGLLFCWGWLAFSAIWEALGGKNQYGQSYIYRCLDWSYPLNGGGRNAQGKLLILNAFIFVPLTNYLYWLLLWARRRSATLYKSSDAADPRQPKAQQAAASRRFLFEYQADFRDVSLDGRHWRAQFGGSSHPHAPKMGAYLFCGARGYLAFRLTLAAMAVGLMVVRVVESGTSFLGVPVDKPHVWLFLYFETWVLALAAAYFLLAACLTAVATCSAGAESSSTPLAVWFAGAFYGALLPAALTNALLFTLVCEGNLPFLAGDVSADLALDCACVYGPLLLVLLDAWLNRQPYYASFHGLVGCLFCAAYKLFNILWVCLGGKDGQGNPYIYRALRWDYAPTAAAWLTPGKLVYLELILVVPFLNSLYWSMLWSRRRARVASKQPAATKLSI